MFNIDWNHLFQVAFAAIVGGAAVVSLFSLGVRFLVNAESAKTNATTGQLVDLRKEAAFRALAYVMFAVSFGAVIFGVLLIIPKLIPSV
jgi:hypothetical protein